MIITPVHIITAGQIFIHAIRRRLFGPRRYKGDATAICKDIIEGCWNKKKEYFRTSRGNYPVLFSRDFGMCVDALLALGEKERVHKTLAYALGSYERKGRFSLVVDPFGILWDFPNVYSPDGFAFFLHSLTALGDKELVKQHKEFLNQELKRFYLEVVDTTTGLAIRNKHFGGMRDYAVRDSSCYDNAMIAAVKLYATKLGLQNPLKKWKYDKLLLKQFWEGDFFVDDKRNLHEVTGDANVAPLWFRIFSKQKEGELFKKVVKILHDRELDAPMPLRYEPEWNHSQKMIWLDRIAGGWERDTVWLHLGNMFLQVVARHNKRLAKKYLLQHKELIERERCYPEVLTKEGKFFKSIFFHSDCSMLWAANYLALERTFRK